VKESIPVLKTYPTKHLVLFWHIDTHRKIFGDV
jgi:hypothetical protein